MLRSEHSALLLKSSPFNGGIELFRRGLSQVLRCMGQLLSVLEEIY